VKLADLDPEFVRTELATTPEFLAGLDRMMEAREQTAPRVGDPAPDFSLRQLDAEGTVRLSDFHGKSPVALIFGSYT